MRNRRHRSFFGQGCLRKLYWRRVWLGVLAIALALMVACASRSQPIESASTPAPANCGSPAGGPADNPIAAYYGDEAPTWTNQIRWQCVFNINDYPGQTDMDRFQRAQQVANAAGGGVVYLPEGLYTFNDDLVLADQVVVRGAPSAVPNAREEDFRPLTRLEFPKYEPSFSGSGTPNDTAFKQIRPQLPNSDRNQGLVFLDINRGAIAFAGDPDGGTMANRVIFGVRSNNVAAPDAQIPNQAFQPGWVRFCDRFAANIRLTVQAHAFVANNRLNDAITDAYGQPGYPVRSIDKRSVVTYAEDAKVPFSYSDHYAIVVNRSKPGGFNYARSPEDEPGLFRSGVTIRDNWIYKTMRVGILASGQGLVIRGNAIHDQPQKQAWVDPTGQRQPRGHMTYENRAIDWSGHDVLIADNAYEVFRHQIMDSQYQSTDGEGILTQQCCGGSSVEQVTIRQNRGTGYIGVYKVPDIRQLTIANNQVRSHSPDFPAIYVNADTNNAPGSMDEVAIADNGAIGGILAQASRGIADTSISGNQGEGRLSYSCGVTAMGNSGFQEETCLD